MRNMLRVAIAAVLCFWLFCACRSPEPKPGPEPTTPTKNADVAGDPPTTPTTTASTTSDPKEEGLPPFDGTCKSDAECGVYGFSYGPGGCCNICNGSVGNKAWIARAAKACDTTLGWSKSCPMMAMGACKEAKSAACKAGQCVAVY